MSITDAVIPVGGLGTRLLPATRSQPKEMLPVVDKPVVQYVVEELVRAGITRVLFVTGRRKRAIEDHFDADPELDTGPLIDPRTGLQILYTRQAHPAGLGDAIRYAEGFGDERGVVVALGDAMIETPASSGSGIVPRLIETFSQSADVAAAFAVATVADEAVSRYGIAVGEPGDAPFAVERLVEKPDPSDVSSRTAIMGRYVLGPEVFAALREVDRDASGEVQLTSALERVVESGRRVIAVPLAPGERRHDVGSVQSYCEVFLQYALTDPRIGPALRARAAELIGDERR
ncbi:MAG TPA: sugar phosphate nucleotidyltransferase [Solirubrobacteraceae bacterium]